MSINQATATASKFGAIGLDLGLFGRIVRLLLGTAMVAGIFGDLATSNPSAMFLAEAAAYFVLSLVAYTVAFHALRDRILARMNPWSERRFFLRLFWLSSCSMSDRRPSRSASMLTWRLPASRFIHEIWRMRGRRVPSLLFGKRYAVYCPYNVIDLVEKAVWERRKGG